jgi:hypothetical protein
MESFPTYQVSAGDRGDVSVDVKHRIWLDGRIRVDGARTKVLRDTGGWYVVQGPHVGETARVLYREMQDLAVICWPETVLRIPFRAGEGHFEWEGRPYHISSMIQGDILVDQEGRSVVRGHATAAGMHLETVAAELVPIIRPLAWALAIRSEFVGLDHHFEPRMEIG